ncbi:MAG: BrnA antitoxin family protein [Gallionella sp.]|nr:BrnA antitoxin family protein [Gallionella sp.]
MQCRCGCFEPAEDAPDASALMRATLTKRRAGRPLGSGNKEQVSVRFNTEVLAAFRASGAGWQTRINAALADWLKSHSPDELRGKGEFPAANPLYALRVHSIL